MGPYTREMRRTSIRLLRSTGGRSTSRVLAAVQNDADQENNADQENAANSLTQHVAAAGRAHPGNYAAALTLLVYNSACIGRAGDDDHPHKPHRAPIASPSGRPHTLGGIAAPVRVRPYCSYICFL